jgi:hypothetical protein
LVDCDARKITPNLTFSLGGQSLSLVGYDYTSEIIGIDDDGKEFRMCMFEVHNSTKLGFEMDVIVLGKPFMETFYT